MNMSAMNELDPEADGVSLGLRKGGMVLKPKMVKQPGYMHGGKITMPTGYKKGGKITMPTGYKKGGKIGDVNKDDGTDKVEVMAREGEYFLNPETVARGFGDGDYNQGVRNLNAIVRQSTGKEPGPVPVGKDGKKGFVLSGANIPDSQLRPEFRGGGMSGFSVDDVNRMQQRAFTDRVIAQQAAQQPAAAPTATNPNVGPGRPSAQAQAFRAGQAPTQPAAAQPVAPAAAQPPASRVARAGNLVGRGVRGIGAPAAGAAFLGSLGDYTIDDPGVDSSAAGTLSSLKDGEFGKVGRSLSKGALELGMDVGGFGAKILDTFGGSGNVDRYNSALRSTFGDQLRIGGQAAPAPAAAAASAADPANQTDAVARRTGFTPRTTDRGDPRDSMKDFSEDLAGVPAALPPGLREGVIFKTTDANGRPVYSGKNVGPDAKFVNGLGADVQPRGFVGIAPAGGMSGPSREVSDQLRASLSAAADRGDFDAIRNFYNPGSAPQGGVTVIGESSGGGSVADMVKDLKSKGINVSGDTLRAMMREQGATTRQSMGDATSRANTESTNSTSRFNNQSTNQTSRLNNRDSNDVTMRGQDMEYGRAQMAAKAAAAKAQLDQRNKNSDDLEKMIKERFTKRFADPKTGEIKESFNQAEANDFRRAVIDRVTKASQDKKSPFFGMDVRDISPYQLMAAAPDFQTRQGVRDTVNRNAADIRDGVTSAEQLTPDQIRGVRELRFSDVLPFSNSSAEFLRDYVPAMFKSGDADRVVEVNRGGPNNMAIPMRQFTRNADGTINQDVYNQYPSLRRAPQ